MQRRDGVALRASPRLLARIPYSVWEPWRSVLARCVLLESLTFFAGSLPFRFVEQIS